MPDLPVAAPDHAAVLTLAESLPDGALKRGLVALLAERQQDKERIERLEGILDNLCDWAQHVAAPEGDRIRFIVEEAAAALAVEEDAPTCNSGPLSESMRAAVEEDAENG